MAKASPHCCRGQQDTSHPLASLPPGRMQWSSQAFQPACRSSYHHDLTLDDKVSHIWLQGLGFSHHGQDSANAAPKKKNSHPKPASNLPGMKPSSKGSSNTHHGLRVVPTSTPIPSTSTTAACIPACRRGKGMLQPARHKADAGPRPPGSSWTKPSLQNKPHRPQFSWPFIP